MEGEPQQAPEQSAEGLSVWNYQLEQVNGEAQHDSGLEARANNIENRLQNPLPAGLVAEIDERVAERLDQQENTGVVRDALDQEVVGIMKSGAVDSYTEMIRQLRGHEGQEAKSLDIIFNEAKQLAGKARVNRLRAIKVFGLALNDRQPAHGSEKEWQRLVEEEKELVRVAEITKLRADVDITEEVVNESDLLADEVKFKNAQELEEVLRDYARGDDIPADVKREFVEAAERMKKWPENRVNEILGEPGEQPKEAEEKSSEQAGQAENLAAIPEQLEAAQKPESEYVDRPIFGREAIKKDDIKTIQEQLKEMVERGEEGGAYEAARQLSYLKRAGIKMSERGREVYRQGLTSQVEAMRLKGARVVAQYHVYLKYLGIEESLEAEDRAIIEEGIKKAAQEKNGHLASLAMNAKYLGVLEDVSAIRDDLQADFNEQLGGRVGKDRVALEMARRKYLQVPHELPDKYAREQELINGKLEQYASRGQWDNYARLKSYTDYVRRGEAVDEGRQAKMAAHVEEMAKRAREEAFYWRDYTGYVADAVHLARQQQRGEGDAGEGAEAAEAAVPLNEQPVETEAVVEGENRREAPEQAAVPVVESTEEKADGQEEAGEAGGRAGEEQTERVDAEQYPRRAQFEDNIREFYQASWSSEHDILHRNKRELKWRENDLLRRRRELAEMGGEGNSETRWASQVMEELRRGADFDKTTKEYLMEQLAKHKIGGVEREERRQRYLSILHIELDVAQMMDKPTVVERIGSLWIEKWQTRWRVAKGADKIKALWPWGKEKRKEVIRARQDTIKTMQETATDNEVDGDVRALLQRMAIELEIMNVREASKLVKRKRPGERRTKKKGTEQTKAAEGEEGKKDAA